MTIEVYLPAEPKQVSLAFENAPIQWKYLSDKQGGTLKVTVSSVRIHAAVVIE